MDIFENETILCKDYKIIRQIGSGTFGKVFLGHHKPSSLPVAVKILEKSSILSEADYTRLKRELHIMTRAHHPHIIALFDIISGDKFIFLIMELMQGGELYAEIVKDTKLNEFDAFRYFIQIISALEYLHSCGMTHRDLKPENMLLSPDKKVLKLIDFGLGRDFSSGEMLRTPCGSPNYAPPEMLQGRNYDPRKADIWSLGIVLYAMLTGTLPFDDPQNEMLFQKIIECKYYIPPWISQEAKDLLLRMITPVENRISFGEIREIEWYRANISRMSLPMPCCETSHDNFSKFDEAILSSLFESEVERKQGQKIIEAKHFCSIYAHYMLLKIEKTKNCNVDAVESDASKVPTLIFAKIAPENIERSSRSEYKISAERKHVMDDEVRNFSVYEGIIQINNLITQSPQEFYERVSKRFSSRRELLFCPLKGGFLYSSSRCSFFASIESIQGSSDCCYIALKDCQPSIDIAAHAFKNKILVELISE